MILPKIITWNCRGVGSPVELRHLLLLVRSHNPDILILEETRVSSKFFDKITVKTHFNASLVAKANRFSGDIWILWDQSNLKLELMSLDD